MASKDISENAQNDDFSVFSNLLEEVFDKFYFWRDAPSDKSWAIEKMTEVLIEQLNRHPSVKQTYVSFIHKEFFNEDDSFSKFPDFVMIEISKLVAAIVLNNSGPDGMEVVDLSKLLRSTIDYGRLSNGHQVSVMFDCLRKVLPHITPMSQKSYNHDVYFALVFAVAGTQNYTKRSASLYFIELLKLAVPESQLDESTNGVMDRAAANLKDAVGSLLCSFNSSLMEKLMTNPSQRTANCYNIAANYCNLLAVCTDECFRWAKTVAFEGESFDDCIYNSWFTILQQLVYHQHCDIGNTATLSVQQLVKLANFKQGTPDGKAAYDRLISFVLSDLGREGNTISMADVLTMASSLLQMSEPYSTLVDISILPLIVLSGESFEYSTEEINRLVQRVRDVLAKSSGASQSALLYCAVGNAFAIKDNYELWSVCRHQSVVQSVTLECADSGNSSWPLQGENNMLQGKSELICVVQALKLLKKRLDIDDIERSQLWCGQSYAAAVITFPGVLHQSLSTAMDCYVKILSHLQCTRSLESIVMIYFELVLSGLELHLVNVDPKMREVAAKTLGQLYRLDIPTLHSELVSCKSMANFWLCRLDLEEEVVSQLYSFIHDVIKERRNQFEELLVLMGATQEELKAEMQKCLLCSHLEMMKPIAFSIYSCLAESSDVIRYAEVCLQLSNAAVSWAVFGFIMKLFLKWIEHGSYNVRRRAGGVCGLLLEGWGDLLLSVVHGDDTTSLRCAVGILDYIKKFISRSDVSVVIKEFEDEKLIGMRNKAKQYSTEILKGCLFILRDNFVDQTTNGEDTRAESKSEKDDNFDSRIPRENFTLSSRPFPFSKLVCDSTKLVCGRTESVTENLKPTPNLYAIICFSEVLNNLPLTSMLNEVECTTDEYDKNCLTILQDVIGLVNSGFKHRVKEIEKELIQIILTECVELKNILATQDDNRLEIYKQSVNEIRHFVDTFHLYRSVDFCKFVCQRKKAILSRESEVLEFEFPSEFLNNGLDCIIHAVKAQVGSSFPYSPNNNLKQLMKLYLSNRDVDDTPPEPKGAKCVNGPEMENVTRSRSQSLSPSHKDPPTCTLRGNDNISELGRFHTQDRFDRAVADVMKSSVEDNVMEMIVDIIRQTVQMDWMVNVRQPDTTNTLDRLTQLRDWCCEMMDNGFDSDPFTDPVLTDCY